MNSGTDATAKSGRPPRHLLSGIAVCGVCGAGTRVGRQNALGRRSSSKGEPSPRYKVYECAGSPAGTGFHVSIRQEHLDQVITDGVLTRISTPDFLVPLARQHPGHDAERAALNSQIGDLRSWMDMVRKHAKRTRRPDFLARQELIVLPRIKAALQQLDVLEEPDPLVLDLKNSASKQDYWKDMTLQQQRHAVRLLVLPRINQVTASERGQRGINAGRIDLLWR